MKSAEERILDLLNEKAPMTIRKIAEETSMSHSTCARVLAKLCEEDKIVKNTRFIFWESILPDEQRSNSCGCIKYAH